MDHIDHVWASQAQIEELFAVDQSDVSRHIRNILRDAEVDRESNMQKAHIAGADRPVTLYSLYVILAVGYRANSSRAIAFAAGQLDAAAGSMPGWTLTIEEARSVIAEVRTGFTEDP